ncbi:MAG TPA: hypothetical protein PLF81_14630 [Candidatus Anammoximicrobium sp.]|nr:hypothetical protein [Candidatus Anammoximicrobium sp.]
MNAKNSSADHVAFRSAKGRLFAERKATKPACLLVLGAVGLAAATAWWCLPGRPSAAILDAAQPTARRPRIHPDYDGLVVPPNLAPLNFRIEEPGGLFFIRIRSRRGPPVEILSRSGDVEIPLDRWRRLLAENRGAELSIDVYARPREGSWRRYESVTNEIAQEQIDPYIAYRVLRPDAVYYRSIGIYQRHLESYECSAVLHGRWFGEGCLNCHAFPNADPSHLSLHVRGRYGEAAVLVEGDGAYTAAGRLGYAAWHPSGKLVVFSRFEIQLYYHTARGHTRGATDSDSMLTYYRLDRRTLKTAPPIADKARLETHPTWSPDGRYLYFASAPKPWADGQSFPAEHYAQVRYDLKRVRYDIEKDHWGPVETVLSASRTGRSNVSPRISPDGRFVLFCTCDYGEFPVYQPDSDLYLLNLKSGKYWKLECNSPCADSWHCWSSNGRWIVFSSKRPTGVFTRLYLCHVDKDGRTSKPFLLPQRDPGCDDDLLSVYNLPEFITGPVRVSPAALLQAVRDTERVQVDGITGATAKLPFPEPWRLAPQ